MQAPNSLSLGGLQSESISNSRINETASGEIAPSNSPADQKIKSLTSGLYHASSASVYSTEHHDRTIEFGERRRQLREEVIAEAKIQGKNLSKAEIEEKIGKKIDAARWICVSSQKRF